MSSLVNEIRIGSASSHREAGSVSGLADLGVRGSAGSGLCGNSSERPLTFRVGSFNVGTMRGKEAEVVETLSRRRVDLCCLQETRGRGKGVRVVVGKDTRYKYIWSGNSEGSGGVAIMLAEKWWDKIFEVQPVSDRIVGVRMVIGKVVSSFICVYAPQVGLSMQTKDHFYDKLMDVAANVPASEQLFICGDWNGHIGTERAGYEDIHGGHAIGGRNDEGERLLEFAMANDLVIGNSVFKKRPRHLVTYQSGDVTTQIDYILYRRSFRRHVTNVKVILGEECASQHRLVVGDFRLAVPCTLR